MGGMVQELRVAAICRECERHGRRSTIASAGLSHGDGFDPGPPSWSVWIPTTKVPRKAAWSAAIERHPYGELAKYKSVATSGGWDGVADDMPRQQHEEVTVDGRFTVTGDSGHQTQLTRGSVVKRAARAAAEGCVEVAF